MSSSQKIQTEQMYKICTKTVKWESGQEQVLKPVINWIDPHSPTSVPEHCQSIARILGR